MLDPIQNGVQTRQSLLAAWLLPILTLCGLGVALFAWVNSWPGPIIMTARDQNRIDKAINAPIPNQPIRFTFTPLRDGLTEIELIIVNFEQDQANLPLDIGGATLKLISDQGDIISERILNPAIVDHNDVITLRFDPIRDSASREITLLMEGESGNPISLWGYSLNVWPSSQLEGAANQSKTLTLKTRYAFQWRTAPGILLGQIGRFGLVLLLALFWLPLPGLILSRRIPYPIADPISRVGLHYAIGISLWGLIWFWWTLIGLWFSTALLWILFIGGWSYLIWEWAKEGKFSSLSTIVKGLTSDSEDGLGINFGWQALAQTYLPMIAFLGFVLIVRLLAVRDLSFLPWVDASRHALITVVMRDSGQFIENYQPYLPVDRRPYHYGFHVISASMALMLGRTVTLADQLLGLMQLLSTLTSLGIYTGAVLLTKRRAVGWLAAFFISLPFLFPGYYTTWGRLTQITGVILMPILMALLWHMAKPRELIAGERWIDRWGPAILVAILAAALFLIHARVFLYFVPFAALIGLYALLFGSFTAGTGNRSGWQLRSWQTHPLTGLIGSGLGAFLLIAPRLYYLWGDVEDQLIIGTVSTGVSYYGFPRGYLSVGWETDFWWAIGIGSGILIFLSLAIPMIRSAWAENEFVQELGEFSLLAMVLIIWFALLYILVAGPGFRPNWPIILPQTNLNSAYITLFTIQGILLGLLIWVGVELLTRIHWLTQLGAYLALGILLGAGTLFGIQNQLSILNETTILGYEADLEALDWINENVPPEAKIAHSSWRWLQTTWAGSDGGAWITPLTGRLSSIPPVDHQFDRLFFKEIRELNIDISETDSWENPAALDRLRAEGYQYIMIGEKGGFFDPAELYANPDTRPVFDNGRAWVFEIE